MAAMTEAFPHITPQPPSPMQFLLILISTPSNYPGRRRGDDRALAIVMAETVCSAASTNNGEDKEQWEADIPIREVISGESLSFSSKPVRPRSLTVGLLFGQFSPGPNCSGEPAYAPFRYYRVNADFQDRVRPGTNLPVPGLLHMAEGFECRTVGHVGDFRVNPIAQKMTAKAIPPPPLYP